MPGQTNVKFFNLKDKYTEKHGQENDKHTEMQGLQNYYYTEMHGQKEFKLFKYYDIFIRCTFSKQ